jgi:hypothetical protein
MTETRLEAARRSGSLVNVIGALREQSREETADVEEPAREEKNEVDAAIFVASDLSARGKKGAERRQAISAVQAGRTWTARGIARTTVSREQKLAKAVAWVRTLTPEQRGGLMMSEDFDRLTDQAQELLSDAITDVENQEFSTSTGLAEFDFDSETPNVDDIVSDEDENEQEADSFEIVESFDDALETAEWEGQA